MPNTRQFCKCGNPCTTNGRCSDCRAIYQKEWYQSHKEEHRERAKKSNKKRRDEFAIFIREYKSKTPCVDCGHIFHFAAVDFDHVTGTKKFEISRGAWLSSDQLLEEMAKCVLRCANCHRIKTYNNRLIAQMDRAMLS